MRWAAAPSQCRGWHNRDGNVPRRTEYRLDRSDFRFQLPKTHNQALFTNPLFSPPRLSFLSEAISSPPQSKSILAHTRRKTICSCEAQAKLLRMNNEFRLCTDAVFWFEDIPLNGYNKAAVVSKCICLLRCRNIVANKHSHRANFKDLSTPSANTRGGLWQQGCS